MGHEGEPFRNVPCTQKLGQRGHHKPGASTKAWLASVPPACRRADVLTSCVQTCLLRAKKAFSVHFKKEASSPLTCPPRW